MSSDIRYVKKNRKGSLKRLRISGNAIALAGLEALLIVACAGHFGVVITAGKGSLSVRFGTTQSPATVASHQPRRVGPIARPEGNDGARLLSMPTVEKSPLPLPGVSTRTLSAGVKEPMSKPRARTQRRRIRIVRRQRGKAHDWRQQVFAKSNY